MRILSIHRYEDKIGATTGFAEATTNARANAVVDIRYAISFGVMNQYMAPNLHPSLTLNSDVTQYTVGCDTFEKSVSQIY